MPNLTQNQQARPSEFPEIPIRGPFGGIQSEVPTAYTEGFGQTDILNMVLRKGTMTTRMSFLVAPAFSTNPSEQTNAVFDFYRPDGTRVGGVITNSKLRKWNQGNPGSWTDVTAAGAFTSNTNINSWAVVAGKLLFANGIDNVQLWDGSAGTFAQASANAVPCKYLMELD